MKITKIGHCCLLIEHEGKRILTDPGAFTTAQDQLDRIDLILITHEHFDHLHTDSLQNILRNNPQAQIVTNNGVGKILSEKDIKFSLLTHGQKMEFENILLEAFGSLHADIYKTITPVENTGYFIANRFFYPGDALTEPGKAVEILALPVEGPWMKLSEGVDYALRVRPKFCFPVHDGRLQPGRIGASHKVPEVALTAAGTNFIALKDGESFDFK